MSCVLALDQGTTSSRAILFDRSGAPVSVAQREFRQIYPQPGWVEHDPAEIWGSQLEVMRQAVQRAGVPTSEITAIGITNQRETVVAWNKRSGEPIGNAIVWQCRRTAPMCEQLTAAGHDEFIRARTGLVIDPYFSGTKIRYILDTYDGARDLADRGELAVGTVDSWLLWNLTGGLHATDVTNAGRTMLFDIHMRRWSQELCELLGIPPSILPEVLPSAAEFGLLHESILDGARIPISGVAGDQHAALFGQACFTPGMVKNTYGTGCFILANTGEEPVSSANKLLTTPAWSIAGRPVYALEGSVFIAGAAVQWLRDALELVASAPETEPLARSVSDSAGVYVVPAFVGLGAPYWDSYARGGILGLTGGSTRAHIVRATLEAIAYQSRDVVEAMRADLAEAKSSRLGSDWTLRADGGAAANDFLLQFQADILGVPVERPEVAETTALGAAYLAGIQSGFWADQSEIASIWKLEARFEPKMDDDEREELCAGWKRAVSRVGGWEREA